MSGNTKDIVERIARGRTDLVWDLTSTSDAAVSASGDARLIQWCAYYGDVSSIRFLLERGASLEMLGSDLGLNGAAFHGHWRLCEFLLENGADCDGAAPDTGETPLHAAICTPQRTAHDLVVRVLLAHGANPTRVTKAGVETGAFMRDSRTRAESPLHRAGAFGSEETIDMLLGAGADRAGRDMNGDTPLAWASWYTRPDAILRRLCYGPFTVSSDRVPMSVALLGQPTR